MRCSRACAGQWVSQARPIRTVTATLLPQGEDGPAGNGTEGFPGFPVSVRRLSPQEHAQAACGALFSGLGTLGWAGWPQDRRLAQEFHGRDSVSSGPSAVRPSQPPLSNQNLVSLPCFSTTGVSGQQGPSRDKREYTPSSIWLWAHTHSVTGTRTCEHTCANRLPSKHTGYTGTHGCPTVCGHSRSWHRLLQALRGSHCGVACRSPPGPDCPVTDLPSVRRAGPAPEAAPRLSRPLRDPVSPAQEMCVVGEGNRRVPLLSLFFSF